MIFLLLSIFIGQDVVVQNERMSVDKMFELGQQYTKRVRKHEINQLNAKIKLLSMVKKAKVWPGGSDVARFRYDWDAAEGVEYLAEFSNPRNKIQAERNLKKEIFEAKQAIVAKPPFEFPVIIAGEDQPFGVPIDEVVKIRLVLDKNRCLIEFNNRASNNEYVLKGMSTDGLADGTRLSFKMLLASDGIEKFGGSSLKSYRLLTEEEVTELGEKIRAIEHGEKIRAWESMDGKHSTQAKLVGFDLRTVKLQREDGKVIELPLAKLSKEDQGYVQRALGLEPMDLP